tara:strand:+ start:9910 stop:10419 length:510 start_codon:yes stop_codon:yes gene_type:complete
MEKYSHREIFTIKIDLPISKINYNIDGILTSEIQNKYGNTCNENGYIFKDTIRLLNRSVGQISAISNKSSISYSVKYSADIITPSKNEKYNCIIEEISKMGILAFIKDGIKYNTINDSPLLIIIPLPILQNQDLSIDNYSKGDNINILVEAVRVKYNNNQIQVIGKIDV